uniref:Uncharacterized protein n=1 Tax=Lactuca sativa TaxID=4236 RepID=A0A9R1WGF1_LACSA|nr:hypothetical protein LSAT_V11C100002430 [Lactuca sativa]
MCYDHHNHDQSSTIVNSTHRDNSFAYYRTNSETVVFFEQLTDDFTSSSSDKSSLKAESELNKNEIVSKEENQEKELELKMTEEVQGGGDVVTSSKDAMCEDIQESKIGQHVNTVVDFEESKDDTALTKEILKEEKDDKSIDA